MIKKRNVFKEKREINNISLEELSSKLNITPYQMKRIENFESVVDYKNVEILKEELGISDLEIKEYYDNYYYIKSNESKIIRRTVSLFLAAFAYSVFFYVQTFVKGRQVDYFYTICWLVGVFGFSFLIGSFSLFCLSKDKISNLKYYIFLIILIILLGFSIYFYYKGFKMIYDFNLIYKKSTYYCC